MNQEKKNPSSSTSAQKKKLVPLSVLTIFATPTTLMIHRQYNVIPSLVIPLPTQPDPALAYPIPPYPVHPMSTCVCI